MGQSIYIRNKYMHLHICIETLTSTAICRGQGFSVLNSRCKSSLAEGGKRNWKERLERTGLL
ncbi:MAG: hypothetical protein ACQEQG_03795 [Bacillota bacterium]